MDYPECYELVFQAPAVEDDVVIVHRTERAGAGGYPVYEDESGIVRAEISDRGEVRMLASGGTRCSARRCWRDPSPRELREPIRRPGLRIHAHTLSAFGCAVLNL